MNTQPLTHIPALKSLSHEGNYVAPDFSGRSLATLLPGISSALGALSALAPHQTSDFSSAATNAQDAWHIASDSNIVLLVVDGLGYYNITEHALDAPYLAELNSLSDAGSAGFPSTTATSMSIIGTGQPAGRTGIIGYSAFDSVNDEHANFVSWRGLPSPQQVQRYPVLFEGLVEAGLGVESIGLPRYNASGLTTAALRGPRYVEAQTLNETFAAASRSVARNQLTHVYWAEIDKVGHHEGVGSPQWREALRDFDSALRHFVGNLPTGTQVILTADHGMINADPRQRIDVAGNYGLSKGLRSLGGEPRCTHAYYNSQGGANSAKARWEEVVGDLGVVMSRDEIVDSGLYGEVDSHVYGWLGHLVILAKKNATIVDSSSMSPMSLGLIGVHGSLTRTEMTVPGISFLV